MHIFLGYIYCGDRKGTSHVKSASRILGDTSRQHIALYIAIVENSLLSEYTSQVTKETKGEKKRMHCVA